MPGDDPHDVRLDFTGVDRVPPDLDVRLVDRVLARTIDLRVRPTYSYASAARGFVRRPSATRFELQVGTRAYIDHARPAERSYATRLLPMTPDPIARGGVVRFETAVAGAVALSIFDVSGRKVRELVRGTLDRGAHEVAWHGDDDDGRALAPGVYLLRLAATGRSDTGKIVKIR